MAVVFTETREFRDAIVIKVRQALHFRHRTEGIHMKRVVTGVLVTAVAALGTAAPARAAVPVQAAAHAG